MWSYGTKAVEKVKLARVTKLTVKDLDKHNLKFVKY